MRQIICSALNLILLIALVGCKNPKKSGQQNFISPISENVSFENSKDRITLKGTLSLPNEPSTFPAVILISGNGRNNRDSEFGDHKPFLDISNYLTKNGIAVLRYDKRGVGQSEGNFDAANSYDFAEDVSAALDYLLTRKEIQKNNIGLIGHSEGGLIAPIVASNSSAIAFIVSLAGPSLAGDKILLNQQRALAEIRGVDQVKINRLQKVNREAFELVKQNKNDTVLKEKMIAYIQEISKNDPDKPKDMTYEKYVSAQVNSILRPWMINFLRYDPKVYIRKVKCPVLALNGSRDLQVLAKENLPKWKKVLVESGNKNVTIKELPDLNHQFQTCETGLPKEYATLNESFSPIALREMTEWIKKQVR
ncbi:alpha/beta hydrolase family protein [Galbibacter pacificus]|uniref:Alpha/beta fold hydrolase n=1 Tax=Galbibacter pacificus TaxID=2996052 RepID=A0ABT6FUB3_9FLAO|nr:alpha/beta fold hydrolase [Galbibacter pacificus]MDG3583360.1 alpha/beta fold hydrolase [Galbibacter pacificus]MDG3586841.1 alpha/beta fold hydrolase [Galbibacter pacificus]